MSKVPEETMIRRCQRGDEAAWEALFEQHYEAVCRFLFQQSGGFTRQDVEELAQEVFLAAIRGLDAFHGGSSLQTWLYRIAMNKGRDLIEKRRAAKRGGGRDPLSLDAPHPADGAVIDPPSSSPGPDAQTARNDEFEQLRAVMDRLGGPCRDLIELRYFGDLTYEELAAESDISPKTVTARLARCLQRLAELARDFR